MQVQLACDLQKPLILREREAHTDLLNILDKYKSNHLVCVLRGFSGSQSEAESYLDRKFYFTLSGMLSFYILFRNLIFYQTLIVLSIPTKIFQVVSVRTNQMMVCVDYWSKTSLPWIVSL